MERFLIDYEIADQPEEESEAERKAKEEAEEQRAAKAEERRKAQQRYNQTWQRKEYSQLNLKIPKSLKRAFDMACKERGISGRAYVIDAMRRLCDEEFGVFDLDGGQETEIAEEAERGTRIADQGNDGAEA